MSVKNLENKTFKFVSQKFTLSSKNLNYFFDDHDTPNFKEFKFKKILMRDDEISPSFILCIIDESHKVLANNSIKGEKELVALINSTISHEMRNPLNVVIN
jgi:signal transduction histidine kinase